ncbi:hypothetical protein D3C84_921060 [compost metagenome]
MPPLVRPSRAGWLASKFRDTRRSLPTLTGSWPSREWLAPPSCRLMPPSMPRLGSAASVITAVVLPVITEPSLSVTCTGRVRFSLSSAP